MLQYHVFGYMASFWTQLSEFVYTVTILCEKCRFSLQLRFTIRPPITNAELRCSTSRIVILYMKLFSYCILSCCFVFIHNIIQLPAFLQ